jgi:hypothetical protein
MPLGLLASNTKASPLNILALMAAVAAQEEYLGLPVYLEGM